VYETDRLAHSQRPADHRSGSNLRHLPLQKKRQEVHRLPRQRQLQRLLRQLQMQIMFLQTAEKSAVCLFFRKNSCYSESFVI
jgi:hypothetical protein